MNKSGLLEWLQEQQRQWETLLDQIGPRHMERPGVNGDWSMKDIVAHLTGWNRWLVARVHAAAGNGPEPAPPWPANLEAEDEINAWIYQSNHERPLREVLDESKQVFRQLLMDIEGLPDDVRVETILADGDREFYLLWLGEERFPAGEFFDHFRDDHEPDVHLWLNRGEKG
jgi:hypothetical protein